MYSRNRVHAPRSTHLLQSSTLGALRKRSAQKTGASAQQVSAQLPAASGSRPAHWQQCDGQSLRMSVSSLEQSPDAAQLSHHSVVASAMSGGQCRGVFWQQLSAQELCMNCGFFSHSPCPAQLAHSFSRSSSLPAAIERLVSADTKHDESTYMTCNRPRGAITEGDHAQPSLFPPRLMCLWLPFWVW